ncbi:MAG: sulfate permease, partial [Propioniciclava sp.]
YLYLASLLAVIVRDGGPGWLNIFILISMWSALKTLWIGPISLILLARVRIHEHGQRREDHEAETALVRG